MADLDPCMCQLADLLGGAKTQVVGLIDALIAYVQAFKELTALINTDLEDLARKQAAELSLATVAQVIGIVEAPFSTVLSYTRLLADCDPIASFSKIIKDVKDTVLGDVYAAEYELEQLLASLEAKQREQTKLDRWIEQLQEFRDALEACGA